MYTYTLSQFTFLEEIINPSHKPTVHLLEEIINPYLGTRRHESRQRTDYEEWEKSSIPGNTIPFYSHQCNTFYLFMMVSGFWVLVTKTQRTHFRRFEVAAAAKPRHRATQQLPDGSPHPTPEVKHDV